MSRPIRTLLFSTLYPSSERPLHGIFVETRLRELLGHGGVETRVVAPVPWFWSTDARHGDHAAMARTPRREMRDGVDVLHPRYAAVPKVGMHVAPLLLALGARAAVQCIIDEGFDFDVIDAHYFYPDGVAAALLARWFGKPLVITARGSDLNLIAQHALPRRLMRWAAQRAAVSIGVSGALAERLRAIGAPIARVAVVRNGVDTQRFRPEPQAQARAHLGLAPGGPWLLSVGNLLEVKRHDWVIRALAQLRASQPAARLAIVGAGPLRVALQARAQQLDVADAVVFAGAVPQDDLRWWYSAADLLVLASSREGWPNVLLEAMACGTPVVASRVGGVPEIVTHDELGIAVDLPDAAVLGHAVATALQRRSARERIRQYAASQSWAATSETQRCLFKQVCVASGPIGLPAEAKAR